jgi:pyridoxal phosphate enzyme (YggS family)
MSEQDEQRRAELVGSLAAVRSRIAEACEAAGRDARSVTLVAVTKTYPAADVLTLARLGVYDIGESRDQEAVGKVEQISQSAPDVAAVLRWHFVGRLQSRKCRSVATYAAAVHSVDRVELAAKLDEGVGRAERDPLEVFVQLSLDDDPDRGGAPKDRLAELADAVAAQRHLRLRGIMAVPPMDADPDAAFAELADASLRLRRDHPGADAISAGMSADLVPAIRHGSTHVRVGTALLGRRDASFG